MSNADTASRLEGWKQIAVYLGRTERTVQRWRRRGLPIHRIGGMRRTVFALAPEIDAWLLCPDADEDAHPQSATLQFVKHLPAPLAAGRYTITVRIGHGSRGTGAVTVDLSPCRDSE